MKLTKPVCTPLNEKVALSRLFEGGRNPRLIGYGMLIDATPIRIDMIYAP